MKILIADAGSSKTDWVRIDTDDTSARRTETYSGIGISPVHHDSDTISEELRLARASLGERFDKILFYGTGIGTPLLAGKMESILSDIFSSPDIKADSDMAGAARAVLSDSPGIACIMGTGSNSCHYDGNSIDRKSASLGYILDDEGGGVAFCRRLLSDVFKKVAPAEIRNKFEAKYTLSVSDVVENLYRKPAPNRWLSGFMPFIVENSADPYVESLVRSQIERFFDREFITYPDSELKEEGIGFVGSVAYLFENHIIVAINKRGWRLRTIVKNPIESLINQLERI